MLRRLLLLALVLVLSPLNAPANGFGLFRRPAAPAEVRYSSYYYPTTVYTPVYYPVIPSYFIPTPVAYPAVPLAIPRAAPPSVSGEPPLAGSRPAVGTDASASGARTALRPGESFYTLLPGPAGMGRADDRCSVAFWNLSGRELTLRADGRDYPLAAGRSVTVDVPTSFAWHVTGREAEATRIPTGHASAEILIRR